MNVSIRDTRSAKFNGVAGLVAAAGGSAAIVGTYWDDAWHTDRGRDQFAIPPHLTLYGGVLATSLVLAGWGVTVWRRGGWGLRGIRLALAEPAVRLAAVAGSAVFASAPIDNVWHARYGRDAVLWSPPHMLAVAAAVALSVSLLAALQGVAGAAARTARPLAGAGVLAALLLPVLEYDSDVPQFSPVLYLPVVTAGTVLAFLVLRDLMPGRWSMTVAAGITTALRVAIVAFLGGLGMTLTLLPPILLVAVLDDLLSRRSVSDTLRALAIAVAVPASWLPAIALQHNTATQVPGRLLAQTLLGCLLAALVVVALTRRQPMRLRRAQLLVPPALLVLLLAAQLRDARPALAHDPGQGRPAGTVVMTVTRDGGAVLLDARVTKSCPRTPVASATVTGRRAGRTVSGSATAVGRCIYRGQVEVPDDGRWFVYLSLVGDDRRHYEAWVSISAGTNLVHTTKELYVAPVPSAARGRDVIGALLYVIVTALLIGSVRTARTRRVLR